MAGPMVGPILERLARSSWSRPTGRPTATFPDHEPNPLLEENRQFIIDKVRAEGADLGIAWDGDADRCFFIDDTGEFVAGDFLTALLAAVGPARSSRARTSSTTSAPRGRCPDTVERLGGRALVNRVGHAFFKTPHARRGRRVRRRGLRPLLLRRLLQRRLRHAPGAADPRAALQRRASAGRAARPTCARRTSSPARSTPRSPTSRPRWTRSSERYADARDHRARRHLGRLRRLALQRAPVQHRAAAAPEPREPGLPARTWSAGATRCSR